MYGMEWLGWKKCAVSPSWMWRALEAVLPVLSVHPNHSFKRLRNLSVAASSLIKAEERELVIVNLLLKFVVLPSDERYSPIRSRSSVWLT